MERLRELFKHEIFQAATPLVCALRTSHGNVIHTTSVNKKVVPENTYIVQLVTLGSLAEHAVHGERIKDDKRYNLDKIGKKLSELISEGKLNKEHGCINKEALDELMNAVKESMVNLSMREKSSIIDAKKKKWNALKDITIKIVEPYVQFNNQSFMIDQRLINTVSFIFYPCGARESEGVEISMEDFFDTYYKAEVTAFRQAAIEQKLLLFSKVKTLYGLPPKITESIIKYLMKMKMKDGYVFSIQLDKILQYLSDLIGKGIIENNPIYVFHTSCRSLDVIGPLTREISRATDNSINCYIRNNASLTEDSETAEWLSNEFQTMSEFYDYVINVNKIEAWDKARMIEETVAEREKKEYLVLQQLMYNDKLINALYEDTEDFSSIEAYVSSLMLVRPDAPGVGPLPQILRRAPSFLPVFRRSSKWKENFSEVLRRSAALGRVARVLTGDALDREGSPLIVSVTRLYTAFTIFATNPSVINFFLSREDAERYAQEWVEVIKEIVHFLEVDRDRLAQRRPLLAEDQFTDRINAKDKKGNTALHYAAHAYPYSEIANFLIEKGAELQQKNNEGVTPRDNARFYLLECRERVMSNMDMRLAKAEVEKMGEDKVREECIEREMDEAYLHSLKPTQLKEALEWNLAQDISQQSERANWNKEENPLEVFSKLSEEEKATLNDCEEWYNNFIDLYE
jgi:hypothetical protein